MKKSTFLYSLVLSHLIPIFTIAQKLPEKQIKEIWVPDRLKIDGKINEWGKTLQAFNTATGLYFTLANDDRYLYLVVQARDADIINRVVGGGISLGVKPFKAKDNSEFKITYPVHDGKQALFFSLKSRNGQISDTTLTARQALAHTYNSRLDQLCKSIVIKEKNISDTISVFNDIGIKAIGYFDNSKFYNLEMAVSLDKIGLSKLSNGKLVYHLIVNGTTAFTDLQIRAAPDASSAERRAVEMLVASGEPRAAMMAAPTDFRGEYTLAKKP